MNYLGWIKILSRRKELLPEYHIDICACYPKLIEMHLNEGNIYINLKKKY